MDNWEPIRDFYNRIIGYICTDPVTKMQTGRDFYHRILGYYDPKLNVTRDFYNRIVGRGNLLSALIQQEEDKRNKK